jgi:serine phosphatase RsbU (regulator of sigma subunit)/catechol 2,3-dioxygenase-like lactoylglutathione lyase family enzyme
LPDPPDPVHQHDWLSDRIVAVTHGTDYARDGATVRMDRQDPFFSLQFVQVFVRDQERSLRFFIDKLGFRLISDVLFASGMRWLHISPPDGTASLALMQAEPNNPNSRQPGQSSPVTFFTEDFHRKYKELCDRGVKIAIPPQSPAWGGTFCRFEDPDGNPFDMAGFDEITRGVEERRRAVIAQQESERRAAQELEIARQVQARLFPQRLPAAPGLDYAGVCIQARTVGGDYYDFLDLGDQRLALVIGDIAGKGIAGALLMANLQANLRSQCVEAVENPEKVLNSVNRLLFENTDAHAYATLFFAEFDHGNGRLRYANCGHLAALVLRADGRLESRIERLCPTSTVIGMFEDWRCVMAESRLNDGDVIALYTDGVTESFNSADEEFGEERLIEALRRNRERNAGEIATAIVDEVAHFSGREQYDDITLIIAKRLN